MATVMMDAVAASWMEPAGGCSGALIGLSRLAW